MPRLVVSNIAPADVIDVNLNAGTAFVHGTRVNIRRAVHSGSAYQVATPNNTLRLREATPATFTVTLPPGNYTGVAGAAALQAAINGTAGIANTYAVAFNASTGRLTFSLTAGATNFSLWLANEPRMAAILGFAAADPAPAAVTLTGAFPVRFAATLYYLCSPSVTGGGTGPSLTRWPVIALLANAGGAFGSQYTDEIETSYELGGSEFVAWLVDEFGERAVLNGGLLAIDLTIHVPAAA